MKSYKQFFQEGVNRRNRVTDAYFNALAAGDNKRASEIEPDAVSAIHKVNRRRDKQKIDHFGTSKTTEGQNRLLGKLNQIRKERGIERKRSTPEDIADKSENIFGPMAEGSLGRARLRRIPRSNDRIQAADLRNAVRAIRGRAEVDADRYGVPDDEKEKYVTDQTKKETRSHLGRMVGKYDFHANAKEKENEIADTKPNIPRNYPKMQIRSFASIMRGQNKTTEG
jgi:hypothetical protein